MLQPCRGGFPGDVWFPGAAAEVKLGGRRGPSLTPAAGGAWPGLVLCQSLVTEVDVVAHSGCCGHETEPWARPEPREQGRDWGGSG